MNGLRKGIVVDTHPEDNSVDIVMADDGSRVVGAQVLSLDGSTRTGTVNLPAIPQKADKWDIRTRTEQEVQAIVGYVGRNPVVVGFLYPQINQVCLTDKKTKLVRHQSDWLTVIDGDGNLDAQHPGGLRLRIGTSPDHLAPASMNADKNMKIDRNTEKKPWVRVSMPDDSAVITVSPDGFVTLTCDNEIYFHTQTNMKFQAGGTIKFKAPSGMTFDTPNGHFTAKSTASSDFVAGPGVSLAKHKHTGVVEGGSKTKDPTVDDSSAGPSW